ncbi:hypothetical protein L1987_19857 [Smallanthus sonchifolius]|uniref:Uncharacterized protein n=1 Tax=Smallanthus sonchifolius TaxID=185202 RepID=A0ACB9IQZ3_9ASTR|nr:hypothetical protein L1987_19857 [Smallanthus sonchifolius]
MGNETSATSSIELPPDPEPVSAPETSPTQDNVGPRLKSPLTFLPECMWGFLLGFEMDQLMHAGNHSLDR